MVTAHEITVNSIYVMCRFLCRCKIWTRLKLSPMFLCFIPFFTVARMNFLIWKPDHDISLLISVVSIDLNISSKLLNLVYKAFNDLSLLFHFSLTSPHPLTSFLKLCVYHPKLLIPSKYQSLLTSLQAFV